MPETKSRFLERILEPTGEEGKAFTSERQHSAQAFALHVDYRNGLSSEGTAWSHFGRYKWQDHGDHESLRIVFGPMCAIEVQGHNLGILVGEIREGQLNGIKEMVTSQAQLAVHEDPEALVISSVTAYPDFDKFFEAIKEEAKGEDGHENRHARRIER